jgi:hypothetical protein
LGCDAQAASAAPTMKESHAVDFIPMPLLIGSAGATIGEATPSAWTRLSLIVACQKIRFVLQPGLCSTRAV